MSDRHETDHKRAPTGPYDHARWEDSDEDARPASEEEPEDKDDIDLARENVLEGWPIRPDGEDGGPELDGGLGAGPEPESEPERASESSTDAAPVVEEAVAAGDAEPVEAGLAEEISLDERELTVAAAAVAASAPPAETPSAPAPEAEPDDVPGAEAEVPASEHAPGTFAVPPGYAVLEGQPNGARRAVGVVVSRFNGDITTRLLQSALAELEERGVTGEAITVMPVPGAFELPLAAMALAKTRRFSCVVALGCVVRGDTPHFDYVAGEAASGLQLAGLETGVPVSFGVLTLEDADQAETRVDKGAEAVRTALEMADVFANLRTAAAQ